MSADMADELVIISPSLGADIADKLLRLRTCYITTIHQRLRSTHTWGPGTCGVNIAYLALIVSGIICSGVVRKRTRHSRKTMNSQRPCAVDMLR